MNPLPLVVYLSVLGISDALSFVPAITLRAYLFTLAAFGVSFALNHLAGWRALAYAVLGLSAFTALDACLQRLQMPRAGAWLGSANYLGGFAMLSIFLALLLRRPVAFTRVCVLLNGAAIVASESRGAALGLLCGMFFLLPRKWRLLYLGLPIYAFPVLHWHLGIGAVARIANWRAGWADFAARPLLGWGQLSPHPSIFLHFYNLALDNAVSSGIIGLCALGLLLYAMVRAVRTLPGHEKGAAAGLLCGYLVNGLVIYDTIGTSLVMLVLFCRLWSVNRDIALAASLVDHQDALGARAAAVGLRRPG